jgi:hypothetical protein
MAGFTAAAGYRAELLRREPGFIAFRLRPWGGT